MASTITKATYLDARRELLISARRYRAYAHREPGRAGHFMAWAKAMQRHMVALRTATKVNTLAASWRTVA